MTITQILGDLERDKPMTRPTLYTYLFRFKIKPIGFRQRPQRYPDDAAKKIRKALGLPSAKTVRNHRAA